jgi:bacterial/archaeal transporter family-2 protein
MNYFFLLLAFLIGVANTVQSGVNSQLRVELQNPILASIISFSTGLVALLICYAFFNKGTGTSPETLRAIDWWKWTGGVLGAFYVLTVIFIVRDIGPANMVCLIIAGQLIGTLVIEQFGIIGFSVHPINGWRVLGMALVVGGVYLVLKN